MTHKTQIKLATHGYFFLTVIGCLSWGLMFYTHFIQLFGCHTTIYMFLIALLVSDFGSITLARVLMVLWPVYVVAFLICYLLAVTRKKYLPLAIIASIDVLFSCLSSLRYLQILVLPEFATGLIGTVFSFLVAKWLFQANKQEKVPMYKKFETNP